MTVLTYDQVARLVVDRGFPDPVTAVAIVFAESGGRTDARNLVNNPTSPAHLSYDKGLWQINSYWHAEVPEVEADDPVKATDHAYRISSRGTRFTPWSVFTSGSYRRNLPAATAAVARVTEPPPLTPAEIEAIADRIAVAVWR